MASSPTTAWTPRIPTDDEEQLTSYEAQQTYYTDKIMNNPQWTMGGIFADEGISGTSATKRSEFLRMIRKCRQGKIDLVLVKSISRFARNTVDCLNYIRALRTLGIAVIFEKENINTSNMTGELLTAMFAAIAQKESESISGNMRWSYQHRMKKGEFITCKAPFGYQLENGILEVYEPEAQIVHTIFDLYLAGKSKNEIAAQLNARGIPTRDGKGDWQRSTITYILRNERYVGDALLQKWYTTDQLPYQKKINHGEREQYFLSQSHPPIISRKVFNAAKELLNRRAITIPRHDHDPLSLKIICGICGASYRRKVCAGGTYWICRAHDANKDDCPSHRIPEEEIHAAFLRIYHKLRLHGEPILKQMISDLQSVQERRMLWSLDIVEMNKRISDIND